MRHFRGIIPLHRRIHKKHQISLMLFFGGYLTDYSARLEYEKALHIHCDRVNAEYAGYYSEIVCYIYTPAL